MFRKTRTSKWAAYCDQNTKKEVEGRGGGAGKDLDH